MAPLVHLLHHPVVAKLVRDVEGSGCWASIRVCVVIEALKVIDVINADGIVCSGIARGQLWDLAGVSKKKSIASLLGIWRQGRQKMGMSMDTRGCAPKVSVTICGMLKKLSSRGGSTTLLQ